MTVQAIQAELARSGNRCEHCGKQHEPMEHCASNGGSGLWSWSACPVPGQCRLWSHLPWPTSPMETPSRPLKCRPWWTDDFRNLR